MTAMPDVPPQLLADAAVGRRWYVRAWTCHAATTVMVDDPTVITGVRVVAECEGEQTARLVAEAPALLAALQAMLYEFGRHYLPGSSDSTDAARACVARALQARVGEDQ